MKMLKKGWLLGALAAMLLALATACGGDAEKGALITCIPWMGM